MRRTLGLHIVAGLVAAAFASSLAQGDSWAQRPRSGGFEALRAPTRPAANLKYDGRFTFARVTYQTLPDGYWYRGQPAWSHGYPTSEQNLMRIVNALTSLAPHVEESNLLSLEDPEIFKYPVIYLIEPSWWDMTDAEAVALRQYLAQGWLRHCR